MDIPRPDQSRTKAIKRYAWIAAAVATLAGITVVLAGLEPAAPEVPAGSVWIGEVSQGELIRRVRGPGTLEPKFVRLIAADRNGRVDRVLHKPGVTVTPDTPLLELSNPELVQMAEEARLEVEAAEADHLALEVRLENQQLDREAQLAEVFADFRSAELQVEAEKELYESNIVSRLQYERTKLDAEQLSTRLEIERRRLAKVSESIEAQRSASLARVERLRNIYQSRNEQVEALTIRADLAGVLQEVLVEEGQRVSPGELLARVAKVDELIAELRVPEVQASDLRVGQVVEVDTRNGVVPGEVIRISPQSQNGTVLVDVELNGELPPGARPDLSVDGTIEIDRLADVMYMDRPAYGSPNATVSLFKVDETGGGAHRVQVQLGASSASEIEVLAGLSPGDRVVLSDTTAWDSYDRIRFD